MWERAGLVGQVLSLPWEESGPGSLAPENPPSLKSSFSGGVGECRGRLAADDRRGLVDKLVVLEGLHHEQGKVHPTREVARQDWIAYVLAPHGQALALALLEVAAAHDCPPGVAGKDTPRGLDLVVQVDHSS